MRTVRRLRLRCFSFNIYSDVLSTPLLFALSKLCRPIKSIVDDWSVTLLLLQMAP